MSQTNLRQFQTEKRETSAMHSKSGERFVTWFVAKKMFKPFGHKDTWTPGGTLI
jgi:hypothetical protein